MATQRFVESIGANMRYWCDRIEGLQGSPMRALLPEHDNVYRAVEYGLALAETWKPAVELLLALDYFIEQSGNWLAWQTLLQRALAYCSDDEASLMARLYGLSGRCYRHDRNWEASLNAHRQEETVANRFGLIDMLPQINLNLGTLYWRQRDYDKSAKYCEEALAGFLALGATEREMGSVYSALGLIAYGRGNHGKAITALDQSAGYFRQTALTELRSRSLVNLALAQGAAGDSEAAKNSYLEARQLLEGTAYEMEKTRLELSFGSLLFNSDDLSGAEEAYRRADSPYLRRSGLVYFQGLVTNNLGNVYLEQGRLGEAETILRESLRLWDHAHARLQRINTLGTLARTLAAQGHDAEALAYFDEAIAGAEALPEDGWARQILAELVGEREATIRKNEKTGQAF